LQLQEQSYYNGCDSSRDNGHVGHKLIRDGIVKTVVAVVESVVAESVGADEIDDVEVETVGIVEVAEITEIGFVDTVIVGEEVGHW
jgi:hypothetical protein